MSERAGDGNGTGNGAERVTLPLAELIDELHLTFNRVTGGMAITGRCVTDEVALMMLQRAANVYQARTRLQLAQQAQQQAEENKRVAALLERARGGRG